MSTGEYEWKNFKERALTLLQEQDERARKTHAGAWQLLKICAKRDKGWTMVFNAITDCVAYDDTQFRFDSVAEFILLRQLKRRSNSLR